MPEQNAAQLLADRHVGVQRLHGILEDHADALGAKPVELPLGRPGNLDAVEHDAAADHSGVRQQAEHRKGRLRLSGTRLPDEADGLPRVHAEREPRDNLGVRVANTQFADFEQAHCARLESNRSRMPSPRKLKHSNIAASSVAGISSIHDAPSICLVPSFTSLPSDVCGS